MHVFYLHGFTSSPLSRKGQWLKQSFAAHGIDAHLPDLNVPDFEHLSFTGILEAIREQIAALPNDGADVVLIGSSLGGANAIHFADRYADAPEGKRVSKIVLLAPGIDFRENRLRAIGEAGLVHWRESGWLPVFNYAQNAMSRVHYGFYEDVIRYDSYGITRVTQPILLIHGRNDDIVPVEQSIKFAANRPNVDLRLVDDDHELLNPNVMSIMWGWIAEFLGLE